MTTNTVPPPPFDLADVAGAHHFGRMPVHQRQRVSAAIAAAAVRRPWTLTADRYLVPPIALWDDVRAVPVDDQGTTFERAFQAAGVQYPVTVLRDLAYVLAKLDDERTRLRAQLAALEALGPLDFRATAVPAPKARSLGRFDFDRR